MGDKAKICTETKDKKAGLHRGGVAGLGFLCEPVATCVVTLVGRLQPMPAPKVDNTKNEIVRTEKDFKERKN